MSELNTLSWQEPLFFSLRMRDKAGWIRRGLVASLIFAAMLVGWFLDQKYGKGVRLGVAGGISLALGIGVFLTLIPDLSLSQIDLKQEAIFKACSGAVFGSSVWKYRNIASFTQIPTEQVGKPFSLLLLRLNQGPVAVVGVPRKVRPEQIADFLRARGVPEISEQELLARGPETQSAGNSASAGAAPQEDEPEERGPVLLRQKLAILVFTVSGPILAMDFWKNGGRLTFFGEVPLNTLLEIASIGGAVSFLLYAKRREMTWAWIPGAIAGFGAFYLHIWYTVWFEKESLWNVESILVALVGALPGILMYWGISKILRPRKRPAQSSSTSTAIAPGGSSSRASADSTFSKT